MAKGLFSLLGLEFTEVELELFALQNVSVASATLARAGGDGGEKTSSAELLLKGSFDLGVLLALIVFLLGLLGTFLAEDSLFGLSQLLTLFPSKGSGVVSLIPLTEWDSINLYNGALYESLGTDQLVVAGIVENINDTSFTGLSF
jgi:hypothetical protein